MKLKKLKMYGFKSFMDKTEIVFDDGITAIVGPNGCGKSNIADAIRWVMGEQSAKSLRGSVMQDVIFNGTETKKSLSYCEVSLVFDNSDKSIPLEYDEVVVTRKLYRSGESEYLLNKSTCRLKDITELMRKAQIGREGYSIIGQGRVDQFIALKPEDRRNIFDEATGIAAAKAKKNESERKLARTRENLVRYKDILTEIERQLIPMREQANKAREYLALREQLKHHEVNNFIYRTEQVQSDKDKLTEKILGFTDELNAKRAQSLENEAKYQNALDAIALADEKITELRDKQLELMISKEKAESANELSKQRVELLTAQNKTFSEEISAFYAKIKANLKLIKQLDDQIAIKNEAHAKCLEDVEKIVEESKELSKEVLSALNSLDAIKKEFAKIKSREVELNNSLIMLKSSKEHVLNLLSENKEQIESSDDILSEMQKQIDDLSNEKVLKLESLAKIEDELVGFETKRKSVLAEIDKTVLTISDYEKKKAGATSQLNFVKKMRDGLEGFSTSVKKLLADAKHNAHLNGMIEGVVAGLMKVPQKYELAIEASLGNAIQNVVVEDVEDAKELIKYLKQKDYGTITFLPISFVKQRELTKENSACLKENGVLGVASDLITFDKKYTSVFKSLLGATVVVDNIDNATQVAKKFNSAFKIITLEGEIFSTSGSVSGGKYKPQTSNYLSYDRQIGELTALIDKILQAEAVLNTKKTSLMLENESLISKIKATENSIKEVEKEIVAITENVNALKSNTSTNKTTAELRAEKAVELNNKLNEIELSIKNTSNEIISLYSVDVNEDKVLEKEAEYEKLRETQKEISEKLSLLRIEEVKVKSELSELLTKKEGYNIDVNSFENQIASRKQSVEHNEYIIEKCNESLVDIDAFSKEEIEEINAKLKDVDAYKKEQNAQLKEVDQIRTESIAEVQKLENKVLNLQYERDKIDSDLEVLKQKLEEEYNLNYESALPLKDENYKLSSSNNEIKKLKDKIYNLGAVNVNAIEDSQVLGERFDSMNSQKEDMEKAEVDLKKVIAELTDEMRVKFDEGFKKVNEYFQQTFKELFGGGTACLKLVENDSGDKLGYGVDIEAEPPGKSLQNIQLLSGGEKTLTSIAIIISIMKLRPMPFCLLDEIESALDEVNTVRFAKYIQNFPGDTQFIMVTHKKITMEAADAIFGVTMQEKGVSKIVSVKLSELSSNEGVA